MLLENPALLRSGAFIGGEWRMSDAGAVITVTNPATGAVVGTVPRFGATQTQEAIAAAADAAREWRRTPAKVRAGILRRWYELMLENAGDLARIMTSEQGKPLSEALGEVRYAAAYLEWYAEEAKRIDGSVIAGPSVDKRILVTREPVGVCAAITPWNFPLAMITRKAGPALAAGCPIVVKPASQTPLSALALAYLAERADVPAGVFSVVTGSASEVGTTLATSPLVKKLSFTGSTEVGRILMAQAGSTVKKVSMELGGNAPFIVFDDADIDAAVEGAIASKYRNAGQTCVCTNRFYVQDAVYDLFAERLCAAVEVLKVGNGAENGVTQGPLIDQSAVDKVIDHIGDALEKGARLLCGGTLHPLGGTFFKPTILADATSAMKIAHEETFGPVAALFRFASESEVIELANDTEYGLASYVYSRDLGRVFRVSESLEYGMVGVNTGLISNEMAPFGGVKQSGMGREGSKFGVDDYTTLKYTCIAGL
ncbi:succinate-semialdehyde dehydrogenase (NADP(+)) [Paraburkholderia ginsengiterrae]|uniref:Succinate-semialdehyde dehydrogenase (NADP(+)) n=1 Tax=Paraburkholderia ginsengiterrae TaxID=1462993 RepID=A0A1A9MYN9_9BURK|nr:NAD-dependent succinate-semialdehyde dehydrogenase [Paraburkholderia ginsengiterrae]OAJ52072.1 succinate-semialdehyde dehydrogenase (NADP(+)) [Paraburkholderia ginsengiterrae]OAJ63435.1 succinate-semialdehyde dehydrogenase (NADP(+)) [Paraburkholderia ginsengiterrae]